MCCSKLRASMQKQWEGEEGAKRRLGFRAQVCDCFPCGTAEAKQLLSVVLIFRLPGRPPD